MPKQESNFNFSVKSMQEDGSFAGYASVFGMLDNQNDIIMQGAFIRTLKKRQGEIRLLWQHQPEAPIGVFMVIREDPHGLYVEGQLLLDLQRGAEAYSLLKNNAINGLSIGYSVVTADYNGENNTRLITEVELWEISLVTFPANEAAVVMRVKGDGLRDKGEGLRARGEGIRGEVVSIHNFAAQGADVDEMLLASIDRAINTLCA